MDTLCLLYLHVNVNSVDPWNAKVNPNAVTMDQMTIESGLSGLGVIRVEKLDETPILNNSFGHGNLEEKGDAVMFPLTFGPLCRK